MLRVLFVAFCILFCQVGYLSAQPDHREDSLKNRFQLASSLSEKVEILGELSKMTLSKDLEKSLKYGQQELGLATVTGDSLQLIIANYNIGRAYLLLQQKSLATRYLLEALNTSERIRNYKWIGRSRQFLYYVNMQFSQLDAQLGDLALAHKASVAAKDSVFMSWQLMNFADTYMTKGDTAQAERYIVQAISLLESMGDSLQLANGWKTLTKIQVRQGKYELASQFFEQGLSFARRRGDSLAISEVYRDMGAMEMRRGNPKKAVIYFNMGFGVARNSNDLREMLILLSLLSRAHYSIKNYQEAYEYQTMGVYIKDSLEWANNNRKVVEMQMQRDFDKKTLADSIRTEQAKKEAGLKLKQQQLYTYFGSGSALCLLLVSFLVFRNYNNQKKANLIIEGEKQKSENLLLNILPEEVAEELKQKGEAHARLFDSVTVLFTDFVDFTHSGERMSPQELVDELHNCFKGFDEIVSKYNIEKIKTIGDAYLAVCGLPNPDEQHAQNVVEAAIEIRDFMNRRREELGDNTFQVRIGVHSGSVVAGIVGVKKFAYDIWGDTVNMAARMEQNSEPGKINISQVTYELISDEFRCVRRGKIQAKNKGEVDMYFVEG